jgi:hypothetical protein
MMGAALAADDDPVDRGLTAELAKVPGELAHGEPVLEAERSAGDTDRPQTW